jgi:hypothetical protein
MNALRSAINDHIGSLSFKLKNVEGHAEYYTYYARILSMYGDKKCFVMLFVDKKRFLNVPLTVTAKTVQWNAVRTIYLKSDMNLPEQRLNFSVNDPILKLVRREDNMSVYELQNNYVQLLHNPNNPTKYQYPGSISLSGAIETFSMLCKLND